MSTEPRKIVQIAAMGMAENAQTQCDGWVVALCNDGTVWWIDNRDAVTPGRPRWSRLPSIPQRDEAPEMRHVV